MAEYTIRPPRIPVSGDSSESRVIEAAEQGSVADDVATTLAEHARRKDVQW